jgi:hypothetical protein
LARRKFLCGHADEEGIKGLDWVFVDEQPQTHGFLQQAMEYEGEVALDLLAPGNESITILLSLPLQTSHDAIHLLPENTSAAGKSLQPLKMPS